jgi:hypothetical protein
MCLLLVYARGFYHIIITLLRCVQLGLQMAASPPRVEMRIIGLAETEDGAASYKLRLMLNNPAAALLIPATDQRHLLQVSAASVLYVAFPLQCVAMLVPDLKEILKN